MVRFNLNAQQSFRDAGRKPLLLMVFFLGGLWALLINHLRIEWTINPQYGYGWVVPFLCVFLIWKKFHDTGIQPPACTIWRPTGLLFIFALLYAPTRLLEEANPEWRLVSWALAIELVGVTLLLVYLVLGPSWMRRLAVPILYFLVAIPWPGFVEAPLIQGLTRADTGATVELVNCLGVPAVQHGNVIEVATGEVGIEEACSGIRSFQATLMISLFLGELYQLNFPRRLILILGGFIMSFVFNQVRMSILVWVAAHRGITAIAQWHDPAGFTILVACFFTLWGFGFFLARRKIAVQPMVAAGRVPDFPRPDKRLVPLLLSLLMWVAVVEVSVEAWYRWHEIRLPAQAQWTMSWPTNNPTFKVVALDKKTVQILNCDDNQDASWQEGDLQWQAIFIKWNPGTSVQWGHSPDRCMPTLGYTLITVSNCEWFDAGGFHLPFVVYEVVGAPRPYYIFYCVWNDVINVISTQGLVSMFPAVDGNHLALVLAGLRNVGHRSLQIALSGDLNEPQAEAALQHQLQELIHASTENLVKTPR